MWGEEVAAAVVLKERGEASRICSRFARNGSPISSVPKKIHIVETIPRTATGKIQRKAVASRLQRGQQ